MVSISVIMSVYNEPPYILKQAVDSIINQTFKDFEFIIILDAPDNIQNRELLETYEKKDARIRLFINEKNIGLTKSLNRAIKFSTGKYIARMDADDISLPERFEKQKQFIEENNLDFVGGFVKTIDFDGKEITPCVKVPVSHKFIKNALRFNNCIFHPTWFLKRCIYEKAGVYQGKYVEDYDLILRVLSQGMLFGNVPEIILNYRMGEQSISRSNLFEQYLYMKFLQKKYFSNFNKITIEKYLEKYFSEKRARKYEKASFIFSKALLALKNRKIFSAAFWGLKSVFTSRFYADKILRYFLQFLLGFAMNNSNKNYK